VTGPICWLASYPKSGNTWVRAVYAAACTGAEVDINRLPGAPVPAARELLDDALCLSTSDLTVAEVEVLRPRADEVLAGSLAGPALRKVHDAFVVGAAGEPVVSVAAARGGLYVVRDPRDVAVSLASHIGRPIEAAVELMADPSAVLGAVEGGIGRHVQQRLGSWSGHVRSWLEQSRLPVHVLRYESAIADPVGTFEPALRFAGLALSAEEVAGAVARAAFPVLAGQEAERGFGERLRPEARFFRRWQAGGWRDDLPAALAAEVVRCHGEVMAMLGYCN
jgi:aryl sulfotransferase